MGGNFSTCFRVFPCIPLVPVFVPPVTHRALQFLSSKEARENAGVIPSNLYIFVNTQGSTEYAGGWHWLNGMLTRIGKSGSFNATKNRHRVATILAKTNLSDKEKPLIYEHFGHSS